MGLARFGADDHLSAGRSGPDSLVRRMLRSGRVVVGGGILLAIVLCSIISIPWTLSRESGLYYNLQNRELARVGPTSASVAGWFGYDGLGRSILARCLLGGTISLAVGAAAATIAVLLGVSVGLISGYKGGLVDSGLMRCVDVLYGLPYILLVILFKIAFEPVLAKFFSAQGANLVVLFSAIGLVSWLTMSRVVRGQVLSLRAQPFVEAARAMGLPSRRIFLRHVLPNLVGPITVYATLTVPQAILQESFLSFLGIGITPPMPTWGSLASDAVTSLSPVRFYWWMLVFPCIFLVVTLLCLNFVGDGLRDIVDPKREAAKI
jgi:oligopeptide transport system permease protein